MQGSLRRRGPAGGSEYVIDVGTQGAHRCQLCGKRFWVNRRPKGSCPSCGGEISEADERRRQTKGGFATRKACQVAMSKALVTSSSALSSYPRTSLCASFS